MTFYADLHVHSKFSRATSRDCDLEHLAFWARKKGIGVLGTGDFTHPGWFEEIREKLVPAEQGLYRLRSELEKQVDEWLGGPGEPVRFVLQVEISTIYKKDGRCRKVHHLIYVPDLDKAQHVRERLDRIGNIHSDGRPILGLDSRDLLEIALAAGEGCYLVPAHIWTPWFAVLGSKSGFDEIEHCYGDLTSEIFALETGLSSDPPMNWRLSRLDRYALVSNSDAHSPSKIAREACVFHTELDYFAMRRSLQTGEGYGGTVEFFPEEGKYHYDGHRKCGVCLAPEETHKHGGVCPLCGKPLTLGVMHRVDELADREVTPEEPPPQAAPFRSLIPLEEVLGEIHGVGPKSKAVESKYEELVSRFGSELFLLEHAPLEDVQRAGWPVLAEALSRMRQGRVICEAGFDGEYGKIRLFTKDELRRGTSVGLLFDLKEEDEPAKPAAPPKRAELPENNLPLPSGERVGVRGDRQHKSGDDASPEPTAIPPAAPTILHQLDPQQRAAAEITHGPLLIVAGPGTGKTRTLTHRLAHLIADCGMRPDACLAITFTRRAAGEMRERLEQLLGRDADRLAVMTFHALGLSILDEHGERVGLRSPIRVAPQSSCLELLEKALGVGGRKAARLLEQISQHKRLPNNNLPLPSPEPNDNLPLPSPEPNNNLPLPSRERVGVRGSRQSKQQSDSSPDPKLLDAYRRLLRAQNLVDFDDLVALPVELLEANADLVDRYRSRYQWICVDEYQDVDHLQYRLIRLLAPPDGNLCVIGDPDQAIYGFRGGDVSYFQRFEEDFPSARTVSLVRNYRSTRTIVDASLQVMEPASLVTGRSLDARLEGPERIEIHECTTDRAEAEFVVHSIERMIGGSTFFSMDSGRVETHEGEALSFGDFAVLYRTDAQAEPLAEAFARSGIPFQKRSHDLLADQPAVRALVRVMEELPQGQAVPDQVEQAAAQVRDEHPQADAALPALRSLAARHRDNRSRFFSDLALGVDVDLWDPRADRVALLTLHAAKGLEFPVVFIAGCEDGLIPLHWGALDETDLAEERRLLFVGMTRAQERLLLTHARKRRRRGKLQPCQASPFLEDVEKRLLDRLAHRGVKKRAPRRDQPTLFEL